MWIFDLEWDDVNAEHIARHGINPDEVDEVVFHRSYHLTHVRNERYLLTGRTDGGRIISVILERKGQGMFRVITARDAAPHERRLYQRHTRER